ncbi:hypothetical protein C5O19_12950 [Siphonobacter curvatus]|uniref:Uncharacterized protein n=1 Tax=Siphonobacter curvatus TaxID=2094562 RepID=A0A2S7IS00_9BACT|nr:hypothetical protein C5O19_12950 [Siphonobacter curvatus]
MLLDRYGVDSVKNAKLFHFPQASDLITEILKPGHTGILFITEKKLYFASDFNGMKRGSKLLFFVYRP